MVGAVGVKDLVVIDTPDAVLIADRTSQPCPRRQTSLYPPQSSEPGSAPPALHRASPLGHLYCAGRRSALHNKTYRSQARRQPRLEMHQHRSAHCIVKSDMACVVNGEQELFVHINQSTYIPAGHKYQLENPPPAHASNDRSAERQISGLTRLSLIRIQ
jgi:mannose-1-phosphate guanylyltransferase / mannose-6-phosphate isomerase